jgi:H+/Cl- antiporter ClcA
MSAPPKSELEPRVLAGWGFRLAVLGAAAGSAGAFFLWALDAVTRLFWAHGWLLYLLPVSGAAVAFLYRRVGGAAERGTGLILERIREPGGGRVPKRMAPLVVLGTLATHLCGGSAGREGTAVQMGGSLAGALAELLGVPREDLPRLLMCGVAAGFGAVFGTPWAGAIFAAEVLASETFSLWPLRPLPYCLVAALLAAAVCHLWGAQHSHFHIAAEGAWREPGVWLAVALAGLFFGVLGRGCVALFHGTAKVFQTCIAQPLLRPVAG